MCDLYLFIYMNMKLVVSGAHSNEDSEGSWRDSSPCFRTSSTAVIRSSVRSWLSLAICSPFSRKFCVACSTDKARTWAFLERPFFLLDGPLLLVFTSVVTCGRSQERRLKLARLRGFVRLYVFFFFSTVCLATLRFFFVPHCVPVSAYGIHFSLTVLQVS